MSADYLKKNKGSWIDKNVEDADTFAEKQIQTTGWIDQSHGSLWQEILALLVMKNPLYSDGNGMVKGVVKRYQKSKKKL